MFRHLAFSELSIGSLFLTTQDLNALPHMKVDSYNARTPSGNVIPFFSGSEVYQVVS